jgi:hypothetical protein
MRIPVAICILLAPACSSAQRATCTADEVAAADRAKAKVEAEFFTEAFTACEGRELEDCSEFAAIRDKYRPRRKAAWEVCR